MVGYIQHFFTEWRDHDSFIFGGNFEITWFKMDVLFNSYSYPNDFETATRLDIQEAKLIILSGLCIFQDESPQSSVVVQISTPEFSKRPCRILHCKRIRQLHSSLCLKREFWDMSVWHHQLKLFHRLHFWTDQTIQATTMDFRRKKTVSTLRQGTFLCQDFS